MKSTTNTQITEAIDKKAIGYEARGCIAPKKQDCIVEELSDDAAAKVQGGSPGGKNRIYSTLSLSYSTLGG
jgi:hypothetical protein